MGKSADGLIVDVDDATVNERLERYRKDNGKDGKPLTRREAASRLLAEALARHFEAKPVVMSADCRNHCLNCSTTTHTS